MMSERERMRAGKLFVPRGDDESSQLSHKNQSLIQAFNGSKREESELRDSIIRDVFGSVGEHSTVEQPLYVDYGAHVHIGDDFYASFDCVFMDAAEIKIGNHVELGPRVNLFTSNHPLSARARRSGIEYALPIIIEDDVWIGGNTTVLPGVTIGKGSVIGAGSVVTRDIPAGFVAAGNPCRIVRKLSEEDTIYWEGQVQDYYSEKGLE